MMRPFPARALLGLLCLLLSACSYHSVPPDNRDFIAVTSLSDLAGVYRNASEGEAGSKGLSLSQLIWPKHDSSLAHTDIDAIEVRPLGDNALLIRALGAAGTLREQTFVAGEDFRLVDGRIRLSREFNILSSGPGDPLVGPRYGEVEIGLDQAGHGKFRSSFIGGGLIFLMLPVAISSNDELRFTRISE
jgi:hypothetical protein